VSGHEPDPVAANFRDLLVGEAAFEPVVFAVTDSRPDAPAF
jgi:hypothetical protein